MVLIIPGVWQGNRFFWFCWLTVVPRGKVIMSVHTLKKMILKRGWTRRMCLCRQTISLRKFKYMSAYLWSINLMHLKYAEFIYPSRWVGDQTLLYREVRNAELQRSLDPPPIGRSPSRQRNFSEPVAAFGPPGSNGELNVSVIVSPVPQDFS